MTTSRMNFWVECERVHDDHESVMADLAELAYALDSLERYGQGFAQLSDTGDLYRYGVRLCETIPDHFSREEIWLQEEVSAISPELADFAREMVGQHQQLRGELRDFRSALEQLRGATEEELPDIVASVREQGWQVARNLAGHVALEEEQLRGFL
ncbi:MAG TPA: hemerythrin domain-containing protein [Terriglobales bacterium]|nr:hemerythrin domain-containing protein [Terriglobales bacterium]